MDEVYDPMDIANYLIYLANQAEKNITNLKLQKILYFVNAKYLVDNSGAPLMTEKFERWAYGPVMYKVYSNFRNFGSRAITEPAGIYIFKNADPFAAEFKPFDPESISENVKQTAKCVFDTLIDKDPFKLVEYTHKESIWSDYKEAIKNREAPEYENKELYVYFIKNPQAQIWEHRAWK